MWKEGVLTSEIIVCKTPSSGISNVATASWS